jgi:hypothetical protein
MRRRSCRLHGFAVNIPRFCNFSRKIAVGSRAIMRRLTLAALLLIGGNVLAGSNRVHYSIRGSGKLR